MLDHLRSEWAAETVPPFIQLGAPHKLRLLLVCDSVASTASLRAALKLGAVEIVSVSQAEELCCVSEQEYALAIIDVAPARLLEVLKTLRARAKLARLPVLVEASRIITEAGFAGVLPHYRAMPCSYNELVTLARQRLAPIQRAPNPSKVL